VDQRSRPSPFQLWKQAGGGTDAYDRGEYLRLMARHGHLGASGQHHVTRRPGETRRPGHIPGGPGKGVPRA
jgi:hypothetical protein